MSDSKPKKLVMEKNLSGLSGVRDVSFGDATPERRDNDDFSKEGIKAPESDTFDDYADRQRRWERSMKGL